LWPLGAFPPPNDGFILVAVVKAAADTADLALERQVCERHVDGVPAGDIQKVLRRKGLAIAAPPNPLNYLIPHGLHESLIRANVGRAAAGSNLFFGRAIAARNTTGDDGVR
jgi:hypothetical protein